MSYTLLDTTLLSNFAQVRRPDLLRESLGPDAATTPAVIAVSCPTTLQHGAWPCWKALSFQARWEC